MIRNRVNHPVQNLFVGPAPSTGYHFLSIDGLSNDDFQSLGANYNLLFNIPRIQSLSSSLIVPRENVVQFGSKSIKERVNLEHPSFIVRFDYLQIGVLAEARLGLKVNYAQYEYPYSGEPYYSNNFAVDVIEGLLSRSMNVESGVQPFWPLKTREPRNIFAVIGKEGTDLNKTKARASLDVPHVSGEEIELAATGYHVVGFGNCYLSSYNAKGAVGSFPQASVAFLAENMNFSLSGSGFQIPAFEPKERGKIYNHAVIPPVFYNGEPSALRPGDITLDISSYDCSGNLKPIVEDIGVDFNNLRIQSYDIDIKFERTPLYSLDYKSCIDRPLNLPILVNLDIGGIVTNMQSGSLLDLLEENTLYDLTIKVKNPDCPNADRSHAPPTYYGLSPDTQAIALQYDFKRFNFEGVDYDAQIQGNKTTKVTFVGDIANIPMTGGFFISGLLQTEKTEDVLIDGSGQYVVDYENELIRLNTIPLY